MAVFTEKQNHSSSTLKKGWITMLLILCISYFYLPIVLVISNYLKIEIKNLFTSSELLFLHGLEHSFIWLLLFSIVIDYFVAISIARLEKTDKKRKYYLILSLVTNLGFFKLF